MSHGAEMTKEDVMNTMMTYYRVRKNGPKDKRIRKVELMGEHTAKPLHYIKISQDPNTPFVDVDVVMSEFSKRVGDVGDAYRPVVEGKEREFIILGFFKRADAIESLNKMAINGNKGETVINGVPMTIEVAKSWFIGLYPRPPGAKLTDYRRMVDLQAP